MEPNRRSRTMEYDPVTGCYVRKVPLDFSDKRVEDIVKEEMIKSERKGKGRSSDASWKKPEEKEKGSTPDTALVDLTLRSSDGDKSLPHYVSGEGIETEYQFTVKEASKNESKPTEFDKNGEFADDDIKKAGEAMKAKFEGDRMKFERDSGDVVMSETTKRSFERSRRSDEDPDSKKAKEDTKERTLSLDRRLKEMEERRARLFKDSPEDKADATEVKITRNATTETSYSAPASGDSMLGERMQEAHKRHRNREERIRRRKNAEELISKKSSEGGDQTKSAPMKSTGVKLELRGSAIKKREDTSPKGDSEANAFSGSSYSYRHDDYASDITFTVKKPAESKKDDDDYIEKFDKKESSDWNASDQKSSAKTTDTNRTSASLMDEPIVWSQPGRGTDDDISFSVKEQSRKLDGDETKERKEEKRESRRSQIKETEVTVVESKPAQSLFSSDFGQEEPQDIVFSVKETSTSNKRTTESESYKSKPKELTLEKGKFDEKYSAKSTSNADLLRWEMDNVDSGKPSEPEPFDSMGNYRDSLRRTNALGRVGSFKKGREELPPAVFHDIESDAPAASLIDIRTESPSPASTSRDSTMEADQAPNLLSKFQDEDDSDERRRRRQEIEEKKRRIAESQKKANVQPRRDVSDKKKDGTPGSGSPDNIEDLSEKRRSLLMMWESYAEGDGPGPENRKEQEEGKNQFGYDAMMKEAAQSDPKATVDYRTMDVEDEKEETRAPVVDIDENHKLNDDELKWERAGQFQPGKLKTKFHEIGQDESSSEPTKTWRGVNNNDITEVSTYVTREEQRFSYKTPVEEDQSYADETTVVESAPKQLWDNSDRQTTAKSDDEDEEEISRKPHVDVDEVHRMTEEEARWEKVGHFQPGKINTSIFESRKKVDKNGVESTKIQKREKSRYEQIKKIQRTDSKKELLVPKKVSLKSDRTEDLEEEDENERPYVGKIETPSFGTSEDERQRQEREARNRREMEEIQRERDEERRRQERENLESKESINEFEDDEFEAKVKSRDVGRIDITKFGDFQKKSEPIPEKKQVSKQSTKRTVETRREDKFESVPRANLYSREDEGYDIQFQQGDAARGKPERKTSDKTSKRGYVQQKEVVVSQTTSEVESAPDYHYEEEEYEIKRRSVGKLNKDWLSQAQEQEVREMERRRKEAEMERIRKEQYEIEQLKLEENRRREIEGDETYRDEVESSEQPQSVKKLDTASMTPFLKGGHPSPEGTGGLGRRKSKDEVRQERKLARKESRSKMQTHEDVYAEQAEDVQQSPESFDDRPKAVGRLNTGKYLQMMGEDHSDKERRKKLVEDERMRRELEEMERQKEEEERRKEMDRDDTSSSSSSDRPQNVNKLDLRQFSQFQKQDTVAVPKKEPTKEKARESKKIEVIERQTTDEVESEPLVPETSEREWLERERSEALLYEEKRQNVGKLDVSRLMQSRSEEEQERQSRIKELERQRIIREREEMERLKAEKKKGKKSVDRESETPSEASREDDKAPAKRPESQHDREREEEWTVEEKRKSGVGRLNVDQFMQSMSKEEEEKNRRKLELEKERIRQEAEERERLRMEKQKTSENIKVSTVQEVHSAPDEDFYRRESREEREREEELSVEEKRKSVGRLDVNRFVQSLSDEAEEKRRRKIELEKERIRRENEEKELLRLEQEGENRQEPNTTKSEDSSRKYVIVHRDSSEPRDDRREIESRDKDKYTIIDREREEEMSVEEKRKSVGRLDVSKYMQSLSQEEEEKKRRMMELEKERIRREEEEKEMLRLEQERAKGDDVSRSVTSRSSLERVSRTVVQDVESSPYDLPDERRQQPSRIDKEREEELSIEEKRKSVGRLNVNQYFQSLSEEDQEKRRRKIELEKERIRRENEERELLRREQERSRGDQVEQVNASVVQEVHSAPPDDILTDEGKRSSLEREREEAMSVEEKRKSVGRLDFNQFIQSLGQEDREKQMRKIELERERMRREQEEREMEEKQYRLRESSSSSEQIQTSSVEVVQSEVPQEYEDGDSSQDKKEVGRLDLQRYSQQFTQEARERERRARELEIERLRLEREEMEGRSGSQTVQNESRTETTVIDEKRKYRGDEVDRRYEGRTESIKSEESSDSDKPVPKKLDLSKFSAFQSGSGKRMTKDDSAVKRREKSEAGRQARPKSFAGSSYGGLANGEARSGERVYQIIH